MGDGDGWRACLCPLLCAQSLLQSSGPGSRLIMFGGDETILDTKEPRQDIPCKVTPKKPELGFDLKFHTHFEISFPWASFAAARIC